MFAKHELSFDEQPPYALDNSVAIFKFTAQRLTAASAPNGQGKDSLPRPSSKTASTQMLAGVNAYRGETMFNKVKAGERIELIFKHYYDTLQIAAENGADPASRLRIIVEAIRSLHVGHFFADANGRLNTMTLLNKFLIEEGFSPVIMESTAVFGGAFSVEQLVGQVTRGMRHFSKTFPAQAGPRSHLSAESAAQPAASASASASASAPAASASHSMQLISPRPYPNGPFVFTFSESQSKDEVGTYKYNISYKSLPQAAVDIFNQYEPLGKRKSPNHLEFTNPRTAERLERQLETQIHAPPALEASAAAAPKAGPP